MKGPRQGTVSEYVTYSTVLSNLTKKIRTSHHENKIPPSHKKQEQKFQTREEASKRKIIIMSKLKEAMVRRFKSTLLRQLNSPFSSLSSNGSSPASSACNRSSKNNKKCSSKKNKKYQQLKLVDSETLSIVTGEISIPKRCFYSRPLIKIALQDNCQIDCLQEAATIASCCLQPPYICSGDKFRFDLAYSLPEAASLTSMDQYKNCYTIQVRIEDSMGNLLCYNRHIARAIDNKGKPMQWIQIPLTNYVRNEKDVIHARSKEDSPPIPAEIVARSVIATPTARTPTRSNTSQREDRLASSCSSRSSSQRSANINDCRPLQWLHIPTLAPSKKISSVSQKASMPKKNHCKQHHYVQPQRRRRIVRRTSSRSKVEAE